jgi:hypothetical protein
MTSHRASGVDAMTAPSSIDSEDGGGFAGRV